MVTTLHVDSRSLVVLRREVLRVDERVARMKRRRGVNEDTDATQSRRW